MSALSVLLLADDHRGHADTVLDHIAAIRRHSRHHVHLFNPRGIVSSRAIDLGRFDVVAVHYSIFCIGDGYLSPWFRERIARYRGLKVQFLQDEYRYVDRVTAAIRDMGINVLFSVLPVDEMRRVYEPRLPGVRLEPTLTGYVPARLARAAGRAPASRPIDIGYRGRDLPFWLGRLAYEKVEIARRVAELAPAHGLVTDIGWKETDRIYGRAWSAFLGSCRATLGTPSGASIIDYNGKVEAAVRRYLKKNPDGDFEAVAAAVLGPYEGNIRFDVVSPRVFEAAALGTAMVMFPGWYSGVVEPWRHYLPLERDFSNFGDIAALVRDDDRMNQLVGHARKEVIDSGDYSDRRFVAGLDTVLSEERPLAIGASPGLGFSRARAAPWVRAQKARLAYAPRRIPYIWRAGRWLRARPVVGRLAADPVTYAEKGLLALRAIASQPVERRLFRSWLTDAALRRAFTLDVVLEELLELAVARRMVSANGDGWTVNLTYHAPTRRLRMTSIPRAEGRDCSLELDRALANGLRELTWDHRAFAGRLGHAIERPGRDLIIGRDGVSSLAFLAAASAGRPEIVRAALRPLVAASTEGVAAP
jgi:hypothetical protein